ncbi:MAG: nucleoside-diphosphate sugar epimerase, partial [Pseudomonadota bacterium]|nr:nucleoside-diphosphate sugar epimerase [Pseudomonadota bacterium]
MRVWAITGGRRGNDVLVLGVAKALGVEPQLIHTHLKPPWRWLSPYRTAFPGVRRDAAIAPP